MEGSQELLQGWNKTHIHKQQTFLLALLFCVFAPASQANPAAMVPANQVHAVLSACVVEDLGKLCFSVSDDELVFLCLLLLKWLNGALFFAFIRC